MTETVPKIFAPPAKPIRIGWYARLVSLAVAIGCAAILGIAMGLTPSPEGVGTHEAMHLPSCNMLNQTGIPCPTCGMTTSVAWFYHGNPLASLYVQPAGFVFGFVTGALLLLAGYQSLTGRPIYRLAKFFPTRFWLITSIGIFVLGWGWKIAIHVMGVDGWR